MGIAAGREGRGGRHVRSGDSAGQAILEMAIVLPILAVILGAVVALGPLVYMHIATQQAAYDCAISAAQSLDAGAGVCAGSIRRPGQLRGVQSQPHQGGRLGARQLGAQRHGRVRNRLPRADRSLPVPRCAESAQPGPVHGGGAAACFQVGVEMSSP